MIAGRIMTEAGCDAVKLEGGKNLTECVKAPTSAILPLMGHIGLTPRSIAMLEGFRSKGSNLDAAMRLIDDAKALENAKAAALLVEAVPLVVRRIITGRANVPLK